MSRWNGLLTLLATLLLLFGVLWVVLRVLALFPHTLLLFSLGGLLAYAFDPMVELLRRGRGGRIGPRWRGVALLYAGLALFVLLGGVLLSRELTRQVSTLARERVTIIEHVHGELARVDAWLLAHGLQVGLADVIDHPSARARAFRASATESAVRGAERFARAAFEAIVVLLIALYFLIYSEEMRRSTREALPERLRPYVAQWQEDVNRLLGGFVRGQLLLAAIMGGMAAAACALLGIRFWLVIGLVVVVCSLIPVFGPYLGAVPAVAAALATPGGHVFTPLVRVIAVVLLFVLINEAGSKVLYPRLVGAALGLHEVLVLFVLFVGLEVGGIVGVLFAAPLTALTAVTVAQLLRFWRGAPPMPLGRRNEAEARMAEAAGTP